MNVRDYNDLTPLECIEIMECHFKDKEQEYKYYGGLFKQQSTLLISPHVKKGTNVNSLFKLPFDETVKEKPKKLSNEEFSNIMKMYRHE